MKTAAAFTATLAALSPLVMGDFSIYEVGVGGTGVTGNAEGWQVYGLTDGIISCDKVRGWIWRDSDDVSGGKYGVRCEGGGNACNRSGGGVKIKQLEFNARHEADGDAPHFTYYKHRGGAIVNLNGKKIGTCTPAHGAQFFCGLTVGRAEGTRKLNCVSKLSAHDINSHRP